MGSGETAPTMVTPHQELMARILGPGPGAAGDGAAVLLDTPYGFQENADDISARAQRYFARNVGRAVEVLSWRVAPVAGAAREQAVARLRDARWVFAGPGSPTYALRQWRGTPLPGALEHVLRRGGAVVFASAAALTLGAYTVPVYEVYKAGTEPAWAEGLGLVEAVTGLPAVVVPHYDNTEGGHHDTRFCYLGERRLSLLEGSLPPEVFVLGVDEHTACVLDLAARTATVLGNGGVTVRRAGRSTVFPAGTVVGLDELAAAAASPGFATVAPGSGTAAAHPGGVGGATTAGDDVAGAVAAPALPVPLRDEADRLDAAFSAALAHRDADGCVVAVLDLEQALADWSADTLTSDEGEHARSVLRGMVVRLGRLAEAGARDPRDVLAPVVDALLAERDAARSARDWSRADRVRDRLADAGVEVRDAPEGVSWSLRPR